MLSFSNPNQYPASQSYFLSNSPQVLPATDIGIRLCAPQGLSLYSISKRRLNPPLVPVCVLSARAPNGPEGAAPQPKMSIIYRVCEKDFISLLNTSYFKTQWLSQSGRSRAEGHFSSSDCFARRHVLTRLPGGHARVVHCRPSPFR